MSAELDFSKGYAALAYRDTELPWHHDGNPMTAGEGFDHWLNRAGLNYHVHKQQLFFEHPQSHSHEVIQTLRALVRGDTNRHLSVVGEDYHVVQPREVVYFFKELVEKHGFELETAGALSDGKRVWALAKTGADFTLPGTNDTVLAYLLLATSYNKQLATTGQWTAVRVVCANTLEFALMGAPAFRIPHSREFDAEEMKGELGLLGPAWTEFTNDIQALAATPVSKRQAVEFFMEILGNEEEDAQVALDDSRLIKQLWQSFTTAPGAENTAWGLVNGVTHFADHTRGARSTAGRLSNTWFGQSAKLKRDAFAKAKELAKVA